jgi:hypothetical protein
LIITHTQNTGLEAEITIGKLDPNEQAGVQYLVRNLQKLINADENRIIKLWTKHKKKVIKSIKKKPVEKLIVTKADKGKTLYCLMYSGSFGPVTLRKYIKPRASISYKYVRRQSFKTSWSKRDKKDTFRQYVQRLTSAFVCELCQMLSINHHFGKHYSCHFQGECVVGQVLEASYEAGSGW